MKSGSVSPLVLFILIIALVVSVISFFFSLAEQVFEGDGSCSSVEVVVNNLCYTDLDVRIDFVLSGARSDSVELVIWPDQRNVLLPESDLISGSSYQAVVPISRVPVRFALIPRVQGQVCNLRSEVREAVRC